ncbi:MAG: hypothetical protein HY922_01045 [Elusimicrobia bacterium]|nr:hypothetical protein [Elusimicrobiota bacterium]
MTATAYAACYGRNGHYFEFECQLSRYNWPGKPGKEAKEHRRIFQHLLDTLQFK